jgi:hypothetical protein
VDTLVFNISRLIEEGAQGGRHRVQMTRGLPKVCFRLSSPKSLEGCGRPVNPVLATVDGKMLSREAHSPQRLFRSLWLMLNDFPGSILIPGLKLEAVDRLPLR